MPRPGNKAEKLDGRIRDIDRELRELRKAMRELERTGRTNYVAPAPRIRRPSPAPAAATSPGVAPAVPGPAAEPERAAAALRDAPAAASAAPIEYFETGTSEAVRGGSDGAPLPYPPWRRAAPPPGASPSEPLAADDKQRFANYFSSGFLPGRPLKGERHTQRNRAIAMIVVVVVLAYILYRVIL